MRKFLIREEGSSLWTETIGSDIYEAAELYAEEIDDEGKLSSGEEVKVEIKERNSDTIYKLFLFAEVRVHYDTRDRK